MSDYSINKYMLEDLCNELDRHDIPGNILSETLAGEPFVKIWKGKYLRRHDSNFGESDILFTVHWWPLSKKYSLRVLNIEYNEKIRRVCLPECGSANIYLFKTSNLLIDILKALFSNEENINMNKDQKREEAINSLIHELTIRKIEWKSLGVIQGHPTIRIYNNCAIADIHVLATNSEYVYAIEPDTFRFREHLKNSKYRHARTYPCANDWYVYITARTVGCVIKDFLDPLPSDPEPKIAVFDKLYAKEVIFNDPATIVMWSDGSKTVVKAENEKFDPEKGLAMAISKRMLGNKHNYYEFFKKYVGRYEKKQRREQ